MTGGPRPIGESSRVPYRPSNTTAPEASGGPGPHTAPADPPPSPRTAAKKAKQAEKDARRQAYPVPIGGPDSPRHQFRTLRLNPENALLTDTQFEKKYNLPSLTTGRILGPQSGERNAGRQGVSEATRNNILAKGGPDIGFNPEGDMQKRRKALILSPAGSAPPPDPRPAAEKPIQAEREARRQAYHVPIGGPDSPRHKFRTLRLNPENAPLQDKQFEEKYGLPKSTTSNILGPKSGERNAGRQGVSEETRNRILAKEGLDIGITPLGSLDRRRKALIAAAAAEAPRAEAAAQDPVLEAGASSASPDSPQTGAEDRPAKRPRLDTGLQNEPSLSDYQDPFAWQYRHEEPAASPPYQDPFAAPSPDRRSLPPLREEPGSGERPAAAPQGGGRRSPSPDPEQDFMDAILRSFQDY
jgi:hypothetical protein